MKLHTDVAKGYNKNVANAETLTYKILMIAEKKFHRLIAPPLLEEAYKGTKFFNAMAGKKINGILSICFRFSRPLDMASIRDNRFFRQL